MARPTAPSEAPLLLFDGECGLCSAAVQFILKRDRRRRLRFAALQTELGREIMAAQGLDPSDLRTMVLRTELGEVLVRSDAALAAAPRCSKSRATLALLETQGVVAKIRLYLQQVPSSDELTDLLSMLGMDDARQLMRQGEEAYKLENLANTQLSQTELISAMIKHPKLIEIGKSVV